MTDQCQTLAQKVNVLTTRDNLTQTHLARLMRLAPLADKLHSRLAWLTIMSAFTLLVLHLLGVPTDLFYPILRQMLTVYGLGAISANPF